MLSRREFCSVAATGCALVACTAGDGGVVQIGPVGGPLGDDDDDVPPPDANPNIPPDAHPPIDASVPDASTAPMCSANVADVGDPSIFQLNTPVLFSSKNFFVVRDAGGLYALSSRCTHEQAQCGVSSGRFRCPRHGALFTFDGAIISGPVNRPLVHYPMCLMSSGHVGVDTSRTTTTTDRLDV